MKNNLHKIFTIILMATCQIGFSQNVGINGTGAAPDASAILDVTAANKGLLIPRISITNALAAAPITTPATSLLVYNTNTAITNGSGVGYYYWDGAKWVKLYDGPLSGDAWLLLGNSGTNVNTNFIGTTDNQAFAIRTNNIEAARVQTNQNVSIGTSLNYARLQVEIPSTNTTENQGIYNRNDGIYTGATYAFQNYNNSATNSTKYGIYNYVNSEGTGTHYGIFNYTYMNSAATTSTGYGAYNYLNSYGTGNHRASYNYLYHNGTAISTQNYASYNLVNIATSTNTSTLYGEYTSVDYSAGIRYGEYKDLNTNATYTGTIYGDYNLVDGTGNDLIYGVYADITNTGSGTHYGFYSNTPGGTNDYAAMFYAGNIVANEIGGDYDFRVESVGRTSALHVDAANNVVRFGLATGSLSSNGTTVGGVLVDYVADFDKGGATGTAIGIGSIEFLLDGSSQTMINNRFTPTTNIIYDLGSTTEAWDDVYADDYWNVSDKREKNSITDLTYGLKEILAMRPVSYKMNQDPFGATKLGLIAQETLPLVPEAVKTHDHRRLDEAHPNEFTKVEMERMVMSYTSLIPVLIKATQEQQDLIEKQNKRIEKQNERIEELEQIIKNK